MGSHYDQLTLKERIRIDLLSQAGRSIRRIACELGRAPSTVSRELARNAKPTKQWPGGYEGERAHALAARRRRWDARFKLARQPALRNHVRDRLAMGWSPEQIAGRLALDDAPMRVSHESIYRFVYHRCAQADYWHRLLPRRKHRRGKLARGGLGTIDHIKARRPLAERPQAANTRAQAGHWEADLMAFSKHGQYVLVLHERASRIVRIARITTKRAAHVAASIAALVRTAPKAVCRTIAFDNGTEFSHHYKLHETIGVETFFCDPHAPWQKGGVENAIARMRRTLPRKSDLAKIPARRLKAIAENYNNTPRKCLGFKTPNEIFNRVALQT